jgi:hypothetical protein
MPTARAITVDLTRICGKSVRAWWFDPRTGEAGAAGPSGAGGAGEFAATGSQEFEPPAEGDWALVLDDTSRNLPAPGATGRSAAE